MKYNIIYADPPWHYEDKAGKRGCHNHYNTMNQQELANLNVPDIAAADCVLFMWVTAPQLIAGITLMREWGFEYKTIAFTWVKAVKSAGVTTKKMKGLKTERIEFVPFIGNGHYTRSNPEFVLLGVKGRLNREHKNIHSVHVSEIGKHSQKPDGIRKKIEKLYPNTKKIELFARQKVRGWHAWGNEIESDLTLKVL